jgi:hypothetical protein
MTEGVDVTNSAWDPNFLRLGDDNVTLKGSMLLTLLGGRFFSKLVSHMTEGVDVTNSAWGLIFFKVGPKGTC